MFWNPFKKNKKEEPQDYKIWICYGIENESLLIDINISDYSKESLDSFAKLLAGISTMSFISDTLSTVKDGFKENEFEYDFLMERTAVYAKKELDRIMQEGKGLGLINEDDPCIKPSDALK